MIRSATPADVPTIVQLIRALADFEKLSAVVTESAIHEHLFGSRPYAEVLVAEDGGVVVGFALFFFNYSTFLARPGLYLEDLFVLPEHRSKGLGKELLLALARRAAALGCGRVEWSVLNWNTRAIQFYQSLGATPLDEWTVYRLTGEALAKAGQ